MLWEIDTLKGDFYCISSINGYSYSYFTCHFYGNSNLQQLNISKCYSSTNSAFRLSGNCLFSYLICNNNTSSDGADLEFTNSKVSNIICIFNKFGYYGLIRIR